MLSWIDFPDKNKNSASRVRLFRQLGSELKEERAGRLVRLLGDVDQVGRMARVLIAVDQPLIATDEMPPLLLGTYLRVELQGRSLSNVIHLPRSALGEADSVWIVDDESKLRRKNTEVIFSQGDEVYVRGELENGDRVVSNTLRGALEGTLVEVVSVDEAPAENEAM